MSKLSLLRNTKLFNEDNIAKTSSFREAHPVAFSLLQNLIMEMDSCSILLLTQGVFRERWSIDPEDGEAYLSLLRDEGYIRSYALSSKVTLITLSELDITRLKGSVSEYEAVILLSDEDDMDDFRDLKFVAALKTPI